MSLEKKRIDQMVSSLLAAEKEYPVIGASLVSLLLAAQGQEIVPSLQGGQIMPTMDRVSRAGLKQVFFKSEAGLGFALLRMAAGVLYASLLEHPLREGLLIGRCQSVCRKFCSCQLSVK